MMPVKWLDFSRHLKNLGGDGGRIPTFLSTHPDPGDRYNNVNNLAAEAQKGLIRQP
jgi:predicted Zn-dependent protease